MIDIAFILVGIFIIWNNSVTKVFSELYFENVRDSVLRYWEFTGSIKPLVQSQKNFGKLLIIPIITDF